MLSGGHHARCHRIGDAVLEVCKVCGLLLRELTVSERIMRDYWLGLLLHDDARILRAEAGARSIGRMSAGSYNNEHNVSYGVGAKDKNGHRKAYRLTRTDENAKLAMLLCARGDFSARNLGQKIRNLCRDDWDDEQDVYTADYGTAWDWIQDACRGNRAKEEIAELLDRGWSPRKIKNNFRRRSKNTPQPR